MSVRRKDSNCLIAMFVPAREHQHGGLLHATSGRSFLRYKNILVLQFYINNYYDLNLYVLNEEEIERDFRRVYISPCPH